MALKNVIGIDHAVVMVKDLDKAAENYRQLGFTISPRGTHSAHMGTGNYTIMFDPDYMELLGVLEATEHNAPARAFLDKQGEGIERIAFTAVDSAAGAEEIRARGLTPIGPTDFERPVTLPNGTASAAKFRTFMWPTAEAPGGVRIFACQHKTRETVWIPELMKHANAAKRIRQVLIATPEPAKEAAHLARLIDREPKADADGAVTVPSSRMEGYWYHSKPRVATLRSSRSDLFFLSLLGFSIRVTAPEPHVLLFRRSKNYVPPAQPQAAVARANPRKK